MNKDRRKHIRIPLLNETCKWRLMDGIDTFECKMKDFTQEGCFVETTKPVPPRSYIYVYLSLPGDLGILKVEGQTRWNRWAAKKKDDKYPLGFGVQFVNITGGNKKILEALAVYLRNKQIITVSKRIIEEFFSDKPKGV